VQQSSSINFPAQQGLTKKSQKANFTLLAEPVDTGQAYLKIA
jgi:hypothetical protein